ncbi:MAG: hypothetical protein ILO43_06240 [Clostridia bacterium]|nr:hypothetical protein [Clostridia bacterium]
MTWFYANAGTTLVLVLLILVCGAILWKLISDRRKGVSACDACAGADICTVRAAGKTCGNPYDRVEDMEPQMKKVK